MMDSARPQSTASTSSIGTVNSSTSNVNISGSNNGVDISNDTANDGSVNSNTAQNNQQCLNLNASGEYAMLNSPQFKRRKTAGASTAVFSASFCPDCTGMALSNKEPASLVQGPPITDIFTPFDMALSCLKGQLLRNDVSFSVGAILDQTGKKTW